MITKSTLGSAIAVVALIAAATPAQAETEFSTLAGVEAEVMNAAEMEAVQGKCVSLGCFDWQGEFYAGLGIDPALVNSYYGFYGPAVTGIWTNGADPFSQYLATLRLAGLF